jgi:hypothetical protein
MSFTLINANYVNEQMGIRGIIFYVLANSLFTIKYVTRNLLLPCVIYFNRLRQAFENVRLVMSYTKAFYTRNEAIEIIKHKGH